MIKMKPPVQMLAILKQACIRSYAKLNHWRTSLDKRRMICAALICAGVLFLMANAATIYFFFFQDVTPGIIMENVTVLNVDVGGLSRREAAAALEAAQQQYANTAMQVTVLDQIVEIPAAAAAVTLDAEAAAKAAYAVGRSGSYAHRKAQRFQALTKGVQVDAAEYLTMDTSAIRSALDVLDTAFNTTLVQSTYTVTGQLPDLKAQEEPETNMVLTVIPGTPGYTLDAQQLYDTVLASYRSCRFAVEYSCQVIYPRTVDLDAIYAQYTIKPVSSVMDTETFQATDHSYGYCFDLETAKQLLANSTSGKAFTVEFARVAPKETKDSLEALLFRDVLGCYTAYSGSIPGGRDVNLLLSCQAINGTVLLPGEVFSYNPTLGERTEEGGWKKADGYVGYSTVQTYGGGICQTSSCLYLCAMLADLEIVSRSNHTFVSSYMPFGMDATVSWGGPEFRFRNSTSYPLRIDAKASGGAVTVTLTGTDTKDYYVKMEYEILSTDPYKTVYKEMEKDNENGYKDGDTMISGYTGYQIRTYRCKYSKQTDELLCKEIEVTSTYSRRDKVICKIKAESPVSDATTPIEPTENISDPAETTVPKEPTQETTTVPQETTEVTTAPEETNPSRETTGI